MLFPKPKTVETKASNDTRFIGIRKTSQGWSCVGIFVDDAGKITKQETIREPGQKHLALEALKLCLADLVTDKPWRKR